MIVKLLTEYHLEFLSLKGGCTGSSESTFVKMPHCWKAHVTAQIVSTTFLTAKCRHFFLAYKRLYPLTAIFDCHLVCVNSYYHSNTS